MAAKISLLDKIKEVSIQIELDPTNGENYFIRGDLFGSLGDDVLAIQDFEQAIELNFKSADLYYFKGLSHIELNDFDAAIIAYFNCLEIDPNYVQALNNLGNIYLKRNDLDNAETYFWRAIIIDPKHAKSRNNLGAIYLRKIKYEEAIILFSEAIEIDPFYANAYANRGSAYFFTDKLEEAWKDAKYAIGQLFARNPLAYALEGYLRINFSGIKSKENFEAGIKNILTSIRMGGQHPIPYLFLAKIYDRLGDEMKAKENVKQAYQIVNQIKNRDDKSPLIIEFTTYYLKLNLEHLFELGPETGQLEIKHQLLEIKNEPKNKEEASKSSLEDQHLGLKRMSFKARKDLKELLISFLQMESNKDAQQIIIDFPLAKEEVFHNLIADLVLERCKPIMNKVKRNLDWLINASKN